MHSFFSAKYFLVSIIISSLGHGIFSHVFNAFFRLKIFFEALSSVIPFSSCLQSFPASGSFLMSRLFASGGSNYWNFSFIVSPSNEYSGLFSFRIDWFDLLAVQGTLKSLLQHNSKASFLWRSAFFMVQLSQSVHDLLFFLNTVREHTLDR